MSEMRFDRAMSDAEGLMWRLEKDPFLSSTFGTVLVLDRAPDFDALRRRMERAVIAIPRLGHRVRPAPANLAPPSWVDDPHFDIDWHVRRIACPKPGTMRQLLDLATLIIADPLDRTRPLWQFVVVEGLRGGRAALVQKMHHAINDGERGVELAMQYLDLERDAPEPPPLGAAGRDDHHDLHDDDPDLLQQIVAGSLRIPLAVARQVKDLLSDPAALADAASGTPRALGNMLDQMTDVEPARSPIWTERSLQRRVEILRSPFQDTKQAARRLGGSINTAFLTAAADAAGRYHRALGHPVESLRASMAISTRTADSGSNAFSLARLLVPTGEMPANERFAAIQEAAAIARDTSRSAGLDTLATFATMLPTSLITRLVRQQGQTVDFATSNVKGSPIPVYLAGAQMLEAYPIGPLLGVAFNLTLMSYAGSLDVGLNIDTAAVKDPGLLADCLGQSLRELALV